jgi:hypothetical protein
VLKIIIVVVRVLKPCNLIDCRFEGVGGHLGSGVS